MAKKTLYPHLTPREQRKLALQKQAIVIRGREIPQQRIEDLLTGAFEGGSNYWYIINKYNYPQGQTRESLGIEFPHVELPLKGGSLTIGVLDDKTVEKTLDRAAIIRGLELMADAAPRHWADFVEENDDAITSDVFLQLALFGKVIYA